MSAPIVIIGAGTAGLQIAEQLRSGGHDGPLTLIGEEAHDPYHRPPLSKGFLRGEMTEAQLAIRGPDVFALNRIEHIPRMRVEAIDRAERRVRLADGRALPYAGLALCTGARPRTLAIPGADLDGVLSLRSIDDVRAIGARLPQAQHVVVIGGGFIGLEFAATARKLGKEVTVIEAADRLMARAVSPVISDIFLKLHRDHGVTVRLNGAVSAILGRDGRVSGVACPAGDSLAAEMVVLGVGVVPNDGLARAAGLECANGIVVDACSRTSDPAIVAAGDCTTHRLPNGAHQRLESVQNALEQAKSAAAWLNGQVRPFTAPPWFWSDQYDVKLQMAGLSAGHDSHVIRGAPESYSGSVLYFVGERLVAVDSLNRGQDHAAGRRLLEKGRSPTPVEAADPGFPLMSLAKD